VLLISSLLRVTSELVFRSLSPTAVGQKQIPVFTSRILVWVRTGNRPSWFYFRPADPASLFAAAKHLAGNKKQPSAAALHRVLAAAPF